MIKVTKTYLPPFEEFSDLLKSIWGNNWVTNNGPLLRDLEDKLRLYLSVKHLLFCSNGTVTLQMALKALKITKEVITTPFSYVATTNAILWEGCKPVFVDIRKDTFCIDENKIEASITENTQAILATHVYGFPCNVETIQKIADKYQLKVIYDGAHAFGCTYKGKSLLSFGDISTCSFHATKIFHTVEGGAIICNDNSLYEKLFLYRSFGHKEDEYFMEGINAKNSELHAAMGLCILPKIGDIINKRRSISKLYNDQLILSKLCRPYYADDFSYNYGYYPVVFDTEETLLKVMQSLTDNDIFPRRYFYPSLNKLHFLNSQQSCEISESISTRVLSLPLYYDLSNSDAAKICNLINASI